MCFIQIFKHTYLGNTIQIYKISSLANIELDSSYTKPVYVIKYN